MFDIISYWVVYTLISFMILAVPLYWMCDIIDIIIKDLTNGKFVNAFSGKFRNPWLVKIGFHCKCNEDEIIRSKDSVIFQTMSLITSFIVGIIYIVENWTGYDRLPYEAIALLASNITPYVSTPILLMVGFILIRGVIKKAFSKYEDLESKLSKLK